MPFFGVGCPQPAPEKATDNDNAKDDDKSEKGKKKKKDDEEDDKKKKKKKDDDKDGDDDKKKPDDQAADDQLDGGRLDDDGGVLPATAPIPPGCGPDPAGKLGAKPKLLSSGGQPGASIAVWGKAGETPLSHIAITINADSRCYVDYLEAPPAPDSTLQWMGFDLPKGAVQSMSGIAERGANSFVGFRVLVNHPFRVGSELHVDTEARFYGYVHADGVPYSCGTIPGEKGCAMYQKALVAHEVTSCTMAKGGGPPVLAQIQIKKPTIGGGLKVPPVTIGGVDAGIADASIIALVDAGADAADGGTCNGPLCTTNAYMVKEKDHIYVRLSAGKPKACEVSSGPKVGDVWYFDESSWKKR
jgi:hypothetical protein